MDSVAVLLEVLERDPGDDEVWLALADALEEQGDPRAEATRMNLWMRRRDRDPNYPIWEARLHQLVEQNVRVCLPRWQVPLGGATKLPMMLIPPGTFQMGSSPDEWDDPDERLHRVSLTKGFWLGMHPVTQAQWQVVMGDNPSAFRGDDQPVESVSWEECQQFCTKLSERTGKLFRLPTEAQWEYACRAGTTTAYSFGSQISTEQANYDGTVLVEQDLRGMFRGQTTPVGIYPANPWGIFDVHGNVYEWCQDVYEDYPGGEVVDPRGGETGTSRVLRGGSWRSSMRACRSAFRALGALDSHGEAVGLRVARDLG